MSYILLGGGYQRLRAHLYGSLLYYLQIAQKPEEPDTLQTGTTQIFIFIYLFFNQLHVQSVDYDKFSELKISGII